MNTSKIRNIYRFYFNGNTPIYTLKDIYFSYVDYSKNNKPLKSYNKQINEKRN